MSGVLALALRRQELSRGTVPSAVPVGHQLDSGTNGTPGTNGTLGTRGTISTTPPDCRPINFDAIEQRATDSVSACYLDAWAGLQRQRPLSVAGLTLLHTDRDRWSGEDWGAFFDERAALAFDGGVPRQQAEARAFTCCIAEWLNRNRMRSSPDSCLRCCGAEQGHDPLLPFGTERTGHAWLHSHCWSAWAADRQAEAVAALEAMRIATPTGQSEGTRE